MRRLFFFALAALFLLGLGHLYYFLTGDFHIDRLILASSIEVNTPPENIEKILDQPFDYLGQGHQIYAFISKDGKYVLKLFKEDFLERTLWIHLLPPIYPIRPFLLAQGESKEKRAKKLLNGYMTAARNSYEGLIYYHPHRTHAPFFKTQLNTSLYGPLEIDLNEYVFALQPKMISTRDELHRLLSSGDINTAKKRLQNLLALYQKDYARGILDADHNILDNTGFEGEVAVRIDLGRIIQMPAPVDAAIQREELRKVFDERLKRWIEREYPQYSAELFDRLTRNQRNL